VKIPGEYVGVSRTFKREWPNGYVQLQRAHATPITRDAAAALVEQIVPGAAVVFRGKKGKANRDAHRVTLPAREGLRTDGAPYLRLGIVLHECAHMLCSSYATPHGSMFCRTLFGLVKRHGAAQQEAA
jgi:hypothetical protein